ncbi:MAG: DNA internalization-related competence protein ComEC/Rec2 [Deltaproteobacteria bacterium]|nr:DNA internalization-related competence protein ComEC/Rec2 [Deltaproteobacteria bacterium]
MVVGLLLGRWSNGVLSHGWWFGLSGAALGVAWMLRDRQRGVLVWSALVLLLLGMGLVTRQLRLLEPAPALAIPHADGIGAICEGIVAEHPQRFATGARTLVRLERCRTGDRMAPVSARVLISAENFSDEIVQGMRVRFRGRLRPPAQYWNAGTETVGLRRASEGIIATGHLASSDWMRTVEDTAGPVLQTLRTWRARIDATYVAIAAGDARIAHLLQAMILGDGAVLESEVWEQFRRIGVIHLLVVSGLHVGAVAMVVFWAVAWGVRQWPMIVRRYPAWQLAAPAAILAAWSFAWMTGMRVPALRAAILVTTGFGAIWWKERADFASAITLALLIVLIQQPLALWLPSFQLTFAAVIAIVVAAHYFPPRSQRTLWRWVHGLLVASSAATLGVLPIVAYHFHDISLMGVVTNLLCIPWVSLILIPLGLLCALLALVWPAGAVTLFGAPLRVIVDGFFAVVDWCDHWSGAWQWGWTPLAPELVAWYAALTGLLLLAVAVRHRGAGWRWRYFAPPLGALVIALLACGLALGTRSTFPGTSGRLRVTVLDVGQGSSTVIEFPNGAVYVVDGGGIPESRFDMGRWVVAPALHALHLTRVDRLILSHFHPDHYAGLAYLAERFGPARWETNGSAGDGTDTLWPMFAARVAARGLAATPIDRTRPAWQEGDVHLAVLHPPPLAEATAMDENNRSVVLFLTYGDVRMLIPGDIEAAAEAMLVASPSLPAVDFLVAPHHGSNTSSTAAWVDRVRPRYLAISCGRQNRYRFPRDVVLQRYAAVGTTIYRTDLHGAITAESDGKTLEVHPWREHP